MIRVILSFLFIFSFSFGVSLEERVEALEKKVKQLEKEIKYLKEFKEEKQKVPEKKALEKTTEKKDLILYKPLKKQFKKLSIKESLWNKTDKIILKMEIKNNTGKSIDLIKGKSIIYDEKGNLLMEASVSISKGLNFFKGTKIKPEEILTVNIEFEYNGKNPKHVFVKDTPLEKLKVKFYPTEIHYSDGTTDYIKR